MKKAFEQLNAQQVAFEFHDYKKQGITVDKVQTWLEQAGQDVILNKKGTTWRKLTPEQQAYALENQAQLIETLINQPSMIKRPILETAQGLIVGFDAAQYQQLK